jgi:hypothetical protein
VILFISLFAVGVLLLLACAIEIKSIADEVRRG